MPTVADLARVLETTAPLAYQESYDNAGLQCGDPRAEVTGVLISLDCTPAVVEEAIQRGCNVVVAHHPVVGLVLRVRGLDPADARLLRAVGGLEVVDLVAALLDLRGGALDERLELGAAAAGEASGLFAV